MRKEIPKSNVSAIKKKKKAEYEKRDSQIQPHQPSIISHICMLSLSKTIGIPHIYMLSKIRTQDPAGGGGCFVWTAGSNDAAEKTASDLTRLRAVAVAPASHVVVDGGCAGFTHCRRWRRRPRVVSTAVATLASNPSLAAATTSCGVGSGGYAGIGGDSCGVDATLVSSSIPRPV
ncbi:hypothetical protein OsJ_26945 [Oryza sativa Japonica Group]|uniref:Uncharacterized protein n=1 Tax=Oryza sativa subsp. japonica TaxID=39947 RepID=B9G0E5_ORYSJ|nr:hypothetical protein OsJ_26945 [Oryza sativa Japonica Group]